jgi:solute carrier family 13 (sodium-dependent dicarboxylate transporter), member 2/3/5
MTFHEGASLFVFNLVILLWFFRDPQFMTGWSELISGM